VFVRSGLGRAEVVDLIVLCLVQRSFEMECWVRKGCDEVVKRHRQNQRGVPCLLDYFENQSKLSELIDQATPLYMVSGQRLTGVGSSLLPRLLVQV
jgi:hypothetical protein